jgi:hypothetical protein
LFEKDGGKKFLFDPIHAFRPNRSGGGKTGGTSDQLGGRPTHTHKKKKNLERWIAIERISFVSGLHLFPFFFFFYFYFSFVPSFAGRERRRQRPKVEGGPRTPFDVIYLWIYVLPPFSWFEVTSQLGALWIFPEKWPATIYTSAHFSSLFSTNFGNVPSNTPACFVRLLSTISNRAHIVVVYSHRLRRRSL